MTLPSSQLYFVDEILEFNITLMTLHEKSPVRDFEDHTLPPRGCVVGVGVARSRGNEPGVGVDQSASTLIPELFKSVV